MFLSFEGAKMAFYATDIYKAATEEQALSAERDSLLLSIDNSIIYINSNIESYQDNQEAYKEKTGYTVTSHYQSDIEALRAEKLRLYDEKETIREDYRNEIKELHTSRNDAGGKLAYISIILEGLLIAILAYLSYYRLHIAPIEEEAASGGMEAQPVPPKRPQPVEAVPTPKLNRLESSSRIASIAPSAPTAKAVGFRIANAPKEEAAPTPAQGKDVITLRRAKNEIHKYNGRKATNNNIARVNYYSELVAIMLQQELKEIERPPFSVEKWLSRNV